MTILEIYQRLGDHCHDPVDAHIVLSHAQRDKGRLKTVADDGAEVRLFLERGKPLLVGEYLRSECGKTIQVEGAVEDVVTATCDDWQQFSKACYHLGNRHVKVQIGELWLRILPDHVLEDMLKLMGLATKQEQAVFVPESGAYSGGGHHHHHHDDDHDHSHEHGGHGHHHAH